jgi:hypothetical protein
MQSKKSPSLQNIFWFDAGRAYQSGLSCSLSKIQKFTLAEFMEHCRFILIRYLTAGDEGDIRELYLAYGEGFARGEEFKGEVMMTMPVPREMA